MGRLDRLVPAGPGRKTPKRQIHDRFASGQCYIMLIVFIDIPRVIRNGEQPRRTHSTRSFDVAQDKYARSGRAQRYLRCYFEKDFDIIAALKGLVA
jgi:hypothetical protein